MNNKATRGRWWLRVFEVLAGLKLSAILLLLLLLLTWLGTIEQTEVGLHAVMKKYFSSNAFFLLPEINGRVIPLPLPGAYWVGVLLFVNLLCGGILRIRKSRKTIGVLIAHFGILFLLVGSFVTHHFSERGSMKVWEGEESDVATDYFKHTIEVTEIGNKKTKRVEMIGSQQIEDMKRGTTRLFEMANLSFDLEVAGYLENCEPRAVSLTPPSRGERVVNGFYLRELPHKKEAEGNVPGCYARLVSKDGKRGKVFILWATSSVFENPHPYVVEWNDQRFAIDLRKEVWPLEVAIHLEDFKATFYPGTQIPSGFQSRITRISKAGKKPAVVKMNEPLRDHGYTFFQAQYGQSRGEQNGEFYSVFEVVKNPADQWPLYALLISGTGLGIHFLMKLVTTILRQVKGKAK